MIFAPTVLVHSHLGGCDVGCDAEERNEKILYLSVLEDGLDTRVECGAYQRQR